MMRILLADHHANALWALRTMIQENPEFELVGEAVDANHLLYLSKKQCPHLILVDRELPGSPVEELIASLHSFQPKPIVVVMSSDPEASRMMLKLGADAFVSKGEQPDWLLRSLHQFSARIQKEEMTASDNET